MAGEDYVVFRNETTFLFIFLGRLHFMWAVRKKVFKVYETGKYSIQLFNFLIIHCNHI